MADIELVIKIPEEEYRWIMKSDKTVFADVASKECMLHAIKNGTLLSKGHGDLVDRNAINSRFYDIWKELESYSNKPSYKELLNRWSMCMDTAPVVIEADKIESEDEK